MKIQIPACVVCAEPFERERGALYCWSCNGAVTAARTRAIAAIHRAIKLGTLRPATVQACVDCGGVAQCYDHRDYAKPLDVEPVCRSCNHRRGPADSRGLLGAAA